MHSLRKMNLSQFISQQMEEQRDESQEAGSATPNNYNNTNEVNLLFRRFQANLAARVQQLQLQGGGGSAHLNWLLDACASTLSTHASLTPLLLRLFSPPPSSSSTHRRRADDVLSLLDLCTSLQRIADDVHRQLTLLQRALHTAAQALMQRPPQGSSAAVPATLRPQSAAVRSLWSCLHGLQFLNSEQYKPLAEAHVAFLLAAKRASSVQVAAPLCGSEHLAASPLIRALDDTLLISLLLLSAALSSCAAPSSRTGAATRSVCKIIARYCGKISRSSTSTSRGAALDKAAPWVAPLRQLQRDLKQQQMSCVFLELQRLQASTCSFHHALCLLTASTPHDHARTACSNVNTKELMHSFNSLRRSSHESQACISALRSHLASLFQALFSLRLDLLPSC